MNVQSGYLEGKVREEKFEEAFLRDWLDTGSIPGIIGGFGQAKRSNLKKNFKDSK